MVRCRLKEEIYIQALQLYRGNPPLQPICQRRRMLNKASGPVPLPRGFTLKN